MNKTLGLIVCPLCGEESDLRRCERGARTWYWVCSCGKITPNMPSGQQWIMDRARIFTPEDPQPEKPEPTPAPKPKPAPEPQQDPPPQSEPAPKPQETSGWLDW